MIETETTEIEYAGNGSTVTAYPVTFPFFDLTHIKVALRDAEGAATTLSYGTDYTVTGTAFNDRYSSGQVTTAVAISATNDVLIYRETPVVQPLDYEAEGPFPAESHEAALDRMTMLLQELKSDLANTFRTTNTSPKVYKIESVANTILAFSASRGLTTLDGSGIRALLNLDQPTLDQPTAVWNDADARALLAPQFSGQLGIQLDALNTVYISTGTDPGDWQLGFIAVNNLADLADTSVTGSELNALKTKVDGLEPGATADQTGPEIVAALDTELSGTEWRTPHSTNATSYALFQRQEDTGVEGGDFTSGSWLKAGLNIKVIDQDNIATLEDSEILLVAGTYRFHATGLGFNVNEHALRLTQKPEGSELWSEVTRGPNARAVVGNAQQTPSAVSGEFTINGNTYIRIEQQCDNTNSTQGLGRPCNFAGSKEVYEQLEIWKLP